ncbi:MAG: cytochrome b5 domain-containing protein [Neofamilia sp.]
MGIKIKIIITILEGIYEKILVLLIIIMTLSVVACNKEKTTQEQPSIEEQSTTEALQSDPNTENDLVLSSVELAEYNGKDGKPAYIAIDGIIYDVTDSNLWNEGEHNGFEAGKDLTTELMEKSPHKDSVIERLSPVGTLED